MKKKVLIIICFCTLICFIIILLFVYTKNRNEFKNGKLLNEFITQYRIDAKNDIKNDDIKFFVYGLELPSKNNNQQIIKIKTDSILKTYGITVKNIGCLINPELTKATEEYKKITEVYLITRNGKDWRLKMKNEIQKLN